MCCTKGYVLWELYCESCTTGVRSETLTPTHMLTVFTTDIDVSLRFKLGDADTVSVVSLVSLSL